MDVYLIDGTYELFRQYFGRRPETTSTPEVAAARGVLWSVVTLLEKGTRHVAVATDHVIESFRNELWAGYKTGAGVPPELLVQIPLLEDSLAALGVRVFPMVELEADDALASAAAVVAEDPSVDQVLICTPDKDLAQCVVGKRVVQLESRTGKITDEAGVWERFGVGPESVPDWLAVVGDAADGYPGLPGWGKQSASTVLAHYVHLEAIPDEVSQWAPEVRGGLRSAPKLAQTLSLAREVAMAFRELATLRIDRSLLTGVVDLAWNGPGPEFAATCQSLGTPSLFTRVSALASR
ncbi:MAG: 5-3 exonuclease [Acidimicrobiaceae bacterium]|nr:5-3 exonuclease [Acidimicrobiaceae bacterium]